VTAFVKAGQFSRGKEKTKQWNLQNNSIVHAIP